MSSETSIANGVLIERGNKLAIVSDQQECAFEECQTSARAQTTRSVKCEISGSG